ncbi:hypothetical protein ACLOJK_022012 [Asimina triloba]
MEVGLEKGMKGEGALSSYGGMLVGVESWVRNAFVGGSVACGRKIRRVGAGDEGMGVGLGRRMKGEGEGWVTGGRCREGGSCGRLLERGGGRWVAGGR